MAATYLIPEKEPVPINPMADDAFCFVEENLYIGSYRSICLLQEQKGNFQPFSPSSENIHQLPDRNSSNSNDQSEKVAVLTVDSRKLPRELTDLFAAYKFINVEDSLQFEFIQHFDECFDFINEHRKQRRPVLVHCNAGLSRSATTITAYLMKEHGWDVVEAVDFIRKARPKIELDQKNTFYRQWRLRLLTQTGFPVVELDTLLAESPEAGRNRTDLFCCRICRCPLFGPSNQLSHSSTSKDSLETSVPPSTASSPLSCVQKELFIEPVVWMKDEIAQLEGKLNCPQCGKKVGTFSWFGDKCPCGVFVTPSFHMDKSKVELRKAIMSHSSSTVSST